MSELDKNSDLRECWWGEVLVPGISMRRHEAAAAGTVIAVSSLASAVHRLLLLLLMLMVSARTRTKQAFGFLSRKEISCFSLTHWIESK